MSVDRERALGDALLLIDDLIGYSHLREKVRLRDDRSEYAWAEHLLARADELHARADARPARLPWKGRRFGRLIVTTCRQGSGAPLVDAAWTNDEDGNRYASKAILLTPWRRNEHGERARQRALVVGWRVGA